MTGASERPAAPHVVAASSKQIRWQREQITSRLKRAGASGLSARDLARLCIWPVDSIQHVLSGMLSEGLVIRTPSTDAQPAMYSHSDTR